MVVDDNSFVTENLLKLVEQYPVGGKQIHDANIVATMHVYNISHLLTNNPDDFKRFSDTITVLPLSDY